MPFFRGFPQFLTNSSLESSDLIDFSPKWFWVAVDQSQRRKKASLSPRAPGSQMLPGPLAKPKGNYFSEEEPVSGSGRTKSTAGSHLAGASRPACTRRSFTLSSDRRGEERGTAGSQEDN